MKGIQDMMLFADNDNDDNVEIISSAWCQNRSGVCLSFAIRINVMSMTEIKAFGDEFIRAVKASYKRLIQDYFYAKTDTPLISSTDRGELIMIWSFQGNDDTATKNALRSAGIKKVDYDN